MRKFLVATSFFTRIKLNLKNVSEDEFYNSMLLMPVVGLLIGAWLGLIAWLVHFLNVPAIDTIIVILAYLLITGGLHLDGLADTIDGLMSARDRKRVMEIMKDSRLGSFGAVALIILFLADFVGYKTLLETTPLLIILAPVVGRFCGILNCCFSSYAEGGGGLGKRIVEMTNPRHVILYLLLIGGAGFFFLGINALIGMGVAMVVSLLILRIVNQHIGGMTGDTIGMTVEICQMVYLLAAGAAAVNFPAWSGGFLWQML